MAISGQGRLCAACLGGASLVCAAAPVAGQEREERSLDVRLSGTAVYDSNAARSGKAQAAARGLAQHEMEFRPSASASVILPFDKNTLFADTQVGYEFHSRNKRLESERIAATGGVRLRMLGCVVEGSANYARRLSDVADDFSASPGNVEQVTGAAADLRCRAPVGFSPLASVSYKRSRNALAARRRSDLNSMTATGGMAYEQPSLGRLSLIASLSDQSYPHRPLIGAGRDGIRTVSAMLRLERQAGTLLKGSLSAGYINVDPDLPGVQGFDGPVYGAELTFAPGGPVAFGLSAERTVEASNRLDVSYSRQDQLSLSMRYALGPRLNADVRGTWRMRHFAASPVITDVTPPGSDRNYALGGGLHYVLNRRIELGFDLDYQQRNAAIDLFDYGGLRAGLSAAYRM